MTDSNIPVLNLYFPDTHDTKLVAIADISFYPEGYNVINPTIQVTPPNWPTATFPIEHGGFSVFNSNNLGITCSVPVEILAELPDGIWEFKFTINPATTYSVTRKFMRVDGIRKRWEVAFMKTDLKECDENLKKQDMDVLDNIWYFIEGAVATANDCNYTRAMELYRNADKMIQNFIKSKC